MGVRRIRVDHVGIAATSLEEGSAFWRALGLVEGLEDELVEDQGVTARFFHTADPMDRDATGEAHGQPPRLEVLEPTGPDTPIGRFLARRGPGIQQLALRVDDLEGLVSELQAAGVRLIDEVPRVGGSGHRIAFVHPSSTGGVLVELVEGDDA